MVSLASLANSNEGDRVTDSTTPRPLFRRRSIWVLATVWLTVAIGLWKLWPMEPRLVLWGEGEILGITPDSRNLLTITWRAMKEDPSGQLPQAYCSGPIQLWDLHTGARREICLPDQACSGELVKCHSGMWYQRDPMGWASGADVPFQGNSLLVRRWRDERLERIWQDLVFDYQTQTFRVMNEEKCDISLSRAESCKLSPLGKWYCNARRGSPDAAETPDRRSPLTPLVRILDTKTGLPHLVIDVARPIDDVCFSRDDQYFAIAAGNNEGPGFTQIWRIDSKELVCSIDRAYAAMAFSESGQWLAGCIQPPLSTDVLQIVINDALTGAVIKKSSPTLNWTPVASQPRLAFIDGDRWLMGYTSELGMGSLSCQNFINKGVAWNLADESPNLNVDRRSYAAPGLMMAYDHSYETKVPRFGINGGNLSEIHTGQTLFSIPEDCQPLMLTPDGRTLVVEQNKLTSLWLLAARFQIPIPAFAQAWIGPESVTWEFVDVPNGRTLASIPGQTLSCWTSPDQKTLVTVSNDSQVGQQTINVWDFPPRRQILNPLLWSLVVPGVCLLWSACSRWRRRSRVPV